jgi:hypothetical protein
MQRGTGVPHMNEPGPVDDALFAELVAFVEQYEEGSRDEVTVAEVDRAIDLGQRCLEAYWIALDPTLSSAFKPLFAEFSEALKDLLSRQYPAIAVYRDDVEEFAAVAELLASDLARKAELLRVAARAVTLTRRLAAL